MDVLGGRAKSRYFTRRFSTCRHHWTWSKLAARSGHRLPADTYAPELLFPDRAQPTAAGDRRAAICRRRRMERLGADLAWRQTAAAGVAIVEIRCPPGALTCRVEVAEAVSELVLDEPLRVGCDVEEDRGRPVAAAAGAPVEVRRPRSRRRRRVCRRSGHRRTRRRLRYMGSRSGCCSPTNARHRRGNAAHPPASQPVPGDRATRHRQPAGGLSRSAHRSGAIAALRRHRTGNTTDFHEACVERILHRI